MDDDEGNDEEESAKEEEDSASEHEDAAGEAAIAGEAGEEADDDRAADCNVAAMLIVPAGLTDVTVGPSIPSGTASIDLPSPILFAIDRAEEAFTTKWTKRSC